MTGTLALILIGLAVASFTGGFVLAGLPSFHRFAPNPERPIECVHCGRRAEAHRTN